MAHEGRKLPQLITDAELESVRQALQKQAEAWRYKVEVKKDVMIIYETSQTFDFLDEMPFIFARQKESAQEMLKNQANYQAVLRIVLCDPEQRIFRVDRYFFLDSVEDWSPIGAATSAKLPVLLNQYLQHEDKDSFYELFL